MRFDSASSVVAFDLGGVLADWKPQYAFNDLLPDLAERDLFLTRVCNDEWLEAVNRGEVSVGAAVAQRKVEFPEFKREIDAYFERWSMMIAGPVPGMETVVNSLDGELFRRYLFTNHPSETWKVTLSRLPFLRSLDGAFISGAEKLAKPDRAAYRAFTAKFGLRPSCVLLVDDEPKNIEAALLEGWDAVLFGDSDGLWQDFLRRGLI